MADQDIDVARPIVTRAEARRLGLKRYFNGKPCKHGHVDYRTMSGCCVVCSAARHRDWYNANREHALAYAKKWTAENPEKVRLTERRRLICRPKRNIEQPRRWREKNRDKYLARQKEWKILNPEKVRAGARAAYKKDPSKSAARYHKRRALKIANGGIFISEDIAEIRVLQKDRCAACRVQLNGKGEIDHILPLSRGGSNNRKNLQLLCRKCNASKGARDPIDFMQRLGRLL